MKVCYKSSLSMDSREHLPGVEKREEVGMVKEGSKTEGTLPAWRELKEKR